MEKYGIDDVMNLYGIDSWGGGYFRVTEEGHLSVTPTNDESRSIELLKEVEELARKGVTTPLLLRFPQLLESQVRNLCNAFRKAITEFGYSREYKPVFPIKVNQHRFVVNELLEAGWKYNLGIEVGSKPELLGALALDTPPESLLICNGFKDMAYLSNAILAQKIGKNVIVVVEKPYELEHLVQIVKDRGVKPAIGFRVRLHSKGSGKWEKSGGVTSKFGLSTAQLLEGIQELKRARLLDCLKMFHFHIGSQITEIRRLKNAIKEAARVYAKARKMGVDIRYINVGGGLGVDYDGSRTSSDASVNYTVQEYANDVVYTIKDVCENENVPEPDIVSESGRAMTAYHSVLVIDVRAEISARTSQKLKPAAKDPQVIGDLFFILKNMTVKNYREYYHDAVEHRDEMFALFNLGLLSLEERAKGEACFWEIAAKAVRYAKTQKFVADEFVELEKQLHEKVVCNFSVFQSIPDHWALDQLFPVVPIHRLREKPERRATLVDITCDSDGEIDKFVDLKDIKEALELHSLEGSQPYYLALMLIGAYQDTMGDLHNLFGSVNEAHLVVDDEGKVHVKRIRRGNSVRETLAAFGYDAKDLAARLQAILEERQSRDGISPREARQLLSEYRGQFDAYTYLT
ncbi:MAG TPA: biosynthetic arginine decarboxylase [Candidatus Polarisedimenticolia bacterium]|nr:biosynthetic arginine decarboxylase [Candidatus Polarisedimenticolia bacterium]